MDERRCEVNHRRRIFSKFYAVCEWRSINDLYAALGHTPFSPAHPFFLFPAAA
jgi:hypothetical protein